MFFWKSQNKQLKAQCALARLADQATMGKVRRLDERRSERRTTFSVGVWVIPMNGAVPEIADIFVALTKDLSSKGLSVITNRFLGTSEVLICFSGESEKTFLRADIRNCEKLGLGWLQLGMEVTEIVELEEYPQLKEVSEMVIR
jgi:hypothetical protein